MLSMLLITATSTNSLEMGNLRTLKSELYESWKLLTKYHDICILFFYETWLKLYQTWHQFNWIPDLEVVDNSNLGIAYLKKKMELELINLELKFATKKFNPQISLPLNLLIQKYFFHDNPTSNINYLE